MRLYLDDDSASLLLCRLLHVPVYQGQLGVLPGNGRMHQAHSGGRTASYHQDSFPWLD